MNKVNKRNYGIKIFVTFDYELDGAKSIETGYESLVNRIEALNVDYRRKNACLSFSVGERTQKLYNLVLFHFRSTITLHLMSLIYSHEVLCFLHLNAYIKGM